MTQFLTFWFLCSAVGIQMKLEFFQRKFWTACRQVTKKQPLASCDQNWVWSVKTKPLMFCAQCTALDGKCTISCDNQVRKVTHLWFLTVFCRASVNISHLALLTGYQLLSHRQQRLHSCHGGTVSGNVFTWESLFQTHAWNVFSKILSLSLHTLLYGTPLIIFKKKKLCDFSVKHQIPVYTSYFLQTTEKCASNI